MIFESFSAEETYEFGKKLGEEAKPGMVVCLSGDLGVGKTVFTKGFAAGLGVTDTVNSPTFTIVQEYKGRIPFYHFDVYRIEEPEEMEEIGYEDYFFGEGVCMIEWAELIKELLPKEAVKVCIRKDLTKGTDYRLITVEEERSLHPRGEIT
ncbi:MAG: tRNA (adenosine(37)-N6)-threonylcarbamoyltransferase complex ATPase subunit type 1 TsaE [Lachnospiraceae bacterium]